VPASDTRATTSPPLIRSTATSAARVEAWSSHRSSFAFRPYAVSSFAVTRVSSASTRSAAASTSSALSVMSLRFPIGVATR